MFYIIYGDDDYRCHQALGELKKTLGDAEMLSVNTTVLDARRLTLKELTEVCDVVPFMSASRLIIVEGLLKRFSSTDRQAAAADGNGGGSAQSKEWQELGGYVKRMPPSTTLVLFDPTLDLKGHNSLLKSLVPLADKSVLLSELKGRELAGWIRDYALSAKGKLSAVAANLLAEYIGGDLWALSGEINKLITYCGGREVTDADVREMTSFAREDNIFALVDSVMESRVKEAQVMLHRMLKYGTAPQQILAMIERQFSLVLRVKELSNGVSQQEIRERLSLHPRYPLEKTLKQSKSFTLPRLRRAFHCLLDTDVAIKSGKYEDELALDLLVIELCKH
jgi:DNA polymerase-3 subunit delta